MKNSLKKLLLTSSMVQLIALPALAEDHKKWDAQFELELKAGTEGRNMVIPKFLIPVYQDNNSMLFTDIRTRQDNEDSEEYNLGIGYRQIIDNDWIVGGYGFYDHLRTPNNNDFSQVTFGLEALSENTDIRTNIYIPESDEKIIASGGSLLVSGGNIGLIGTTEAALAGFDAEIGQKLPVDGMDLRIYGGGYHFGKSGYESVTGPRGRIELALNDDHVDMPIEGMEFTFGLEVQHDEPRGSQGFALLEVKIPFGFHNNSKRSQLTPLERRMTKFIERDVDVVTRDDKLEAVSTNGIMVDNYVIVDANDALAEEVAKAGTNSLVIIDGSAGTLTPDEVVNMQAGQVIYGGGSQVTFTGVKSGKTVSHDFAGTRPTIDGTNTGGATFYMGEDGTSINNVDIENSPFYAIYARYGDNISIDNVDVANSLYAIVLANDVSNVRVTDIDITGGSFGISGVYSSGPNITFDDITITNVSGNAMDFTDFNGITATNVTITNAGNFALMTVASAGNSYSDFTITGTGGTTVVMLHRNTDLTFTDSTISGGSTDGLSIARGSYTISNVDIEDSGRDAVVIGDDSDPTDVALNNVTITNAARHGIYTEATFAGITLEVNNTTINGAGGDAFLLEQILGDITVSGAGNTVTGVIGGSECNAPFGVTGSLSYNTVSTCP